MKYILWNATDGLQADMRVFNTTAEAHEAEREFRNRFRLLQGGFYRTFECKRIPVDEVQLEVVAAVPGDEEDGE